MVDRQAYRRLMLDLERERVGRFQVLFQLQNIFAIRKRQARFEMIHAERKRLRLLRPQVITELENYFKDRTR